MPSAAYKQWLIRLEKQKAQADGLMEEWLKRAKLALDKGDEAAARAALERKNQAEETSTSLASQLETQVGIQLTSVQCGHSLMRFGACLVLF